MTRAKTTADADPAPAPRPARWWREHRLALALAMALLATGAAYAARPADADQIAMLMQQLQQGVEREDAAAVTAVLSPGYQDNYGCDQRGVLTFLQEWLWRSCTVRVTIERQELLFATRHRALLRATVRLAGTQEPQRQFSEAYDLEFHLRREAVVISRAADWRNLLTGGPVGWRVAAVQVKARRGGANT